MGLLELTTGDGNGGLWNSNTVLFYNLHGNYSCINEVTNEEVFV